MEQEAPNKSIGLRILHILLGVLNTVMVSLIDFVSYAIIVLYTSGLAAAVISLMVSHSLRPYNIQAPSFLVWWTLIVTLRIVNKTLHIEKD